MSSIAPADAGEEAAGYRAFLSYSHQDVAFARSLHRRVEMYRVPRSLVGQQTPLGPIPRRIGPIFRDRDELPSAADLGEKIREALRASHCLVVVASPWSARSRWVDQEVRAFKAMGRADRIFTIIIDGEPRASDRAGLEAQECFCPALRFGVDRDGELTAVAAEPLAADARAAGDGRNDAVLKVIAGLLGIGFDRLKQREKARYRRSLVVKFGMGAAIATAAVLGYTGLADFNVAVPGAPAIRSQLDHWGFSPFRPVIAPQVVATELARSRSTLRNHMVAVVTQPGWLQRKSLSSVWEFGQIATALARNPGAGNDDLATAARHLAAALDEKPPVRYKDRWLGWIEPEEIIRAETSLWLLMGLSAALPRGNALPASQRDTLLRLLDIAQEAAEQCRPTEDGGWNDVPRRNDPDDHYVYSTALALRALVDLKRANLCWRGDCERRDSMIAGTAAWLIGAFVDEQGASGWRLNPREDPSPNPNLSPVVLGALGHAAFYGSVELPRPIHEFAYEYITELYGRPYQPSTAGISKFSIFEDWRGIERQTTVLARVFWLPWSVDAAAIWSRLAERDQEAPEIRRGLARSLGYMAVTLAAPLRQEAAADRTLPYLTAETMAGLDSAP